MTDFLNFGPSLVVWAKIPQDQVIPNTINGNIVPLFTRSQLKFLCVVVASTSPCSQGKGVLPCCHHARGVCKIHQKQCADQVCNFFEIFHNQGRVHMKCTAHNHCRSKQISMAYNTTIITLQSGGGGGSNVFGVRIV